MSKNEYQSLEKTTDETDDMEKLCIILDRISASVGVYISKYRALTEEEEKLRKIIAQGVDLHKKALGKLFDLRNGGF